MKHTLLYLLLCLGTCLGITSCSWGDDGKAYAKEAKGMKENNITEAAHHPALRRYKIRLVDAHLTQIKLLPYGYTPGDTIDAFPDQTTGPITMAAVLDTL